MILYASTTRSGDYVHEESCWGCHKPIWLSERQFRIAISGIDDDDYPVVCGDNAFCYLDLHILADQIEED